MENASKALIIAGGVLIGIMILTIGVYLFQNAGKLSDSYNEKLARDQINGFNNKFLGYAKSINSQEMVSLINLVKENNLRNYGISEKQVTLILDGVNIQNNSEEWKIQIMESDTAEEAGRYKCISIKYHTTEGYINYMEFKTI